MSALVEDFWRSLSEETGSGVPTDLEEQFRLVEKSEKGWPGLLDFIQEQSLQGSCEVSELPQNKSLIRSGCPVWDKSRVLLSKTGFIDASHVLLPQVSRHYIVTQSPLLDTIGHFWEMVWQLDIHCILMLSQFNEKIPSLSLAESATESANQIHAYIPTGAENGDTDVMECADYVITYETKEVFSSFDLTQLTITEKESGKTRTFQHFAFFSWSPSVQVSPSTRSDNLLDFVFQLYAQGVYTRPSLSATPPLPVLLHCSDGLGRSGGLLLLDCCLRIIAQTNSLKSVKILELVRELRGQRRGLFTDGDQLRTVYLALLSGAGKLLAASQLAEPVKGDKVDSDDESIDFPLHSQSQDADSSDDDFELVNKPVYSSSDIGQDSGSGDRPGSMDSEEAPIAPFQSASLVSAEDNLGTETENVLTTPLESEQLVPHSDLIPGILESETTADFHTSANQAPEETSARPPVEMSEVLESGEPSHSDRLFTVPADPLTPEVKSAVMETPPIRMPADTGSPAERKTAEEHIPSEGVTKRGHTTEKPHTLEKPPTSPPYPPPARGHSLQSVSIFTYLLLPVFAVTLLILILYFVT